MGYDSRLLQGIVIIIISTLVLEGLNKYVEIKMVKSLFQNFVIELWPLWIGLAIGIIYWIIHYEYGFRKQVLAHLLHPPDILRFGVWWHGGGPCCPVDNAGLVRHRIDQGITWHTCPTCHQDYPLVDNDAQPITLERAMEKLHIK